MNFSRHLTFVGVAAAVALAPLAAQAAQTTQFQVSASVTNSCAISTDDGGNVAFGAYDPLSANASSGSDINGSGSIAVACTTGTPWTIGLDGGLNNALSVRRMASGSNMLAYELYTSSARTTVWNAENTVGGTATNLSAQSKSVFARLVGGQNVPAGSYSDTITATVNF